MRYFLLSSPAKAGAQECEALHFDRVAATRCCAAAWTPAFAGEQEQA